MNWPLLAGSLAAVLALAGIARLLKLGGGPLDEAAAKDCAARAVPGFVPAAAILGTDGEAALVRGNDDRIALIKRHGARAAARLLPLPLDGAETEEGTLVDPGDRRFGAQLLRGHSLESVRTFVEENPWG